MQTEDEVMFLRRLTIAAEEGEESGAEQVLPHAAVTQRWRHTALHASVRFWRPPVAERDVTAIRPQPGVSVQTNPGCFLSSGLD